MKLWIFLFSTFLLYASTVSGQEVILKLNPSKKATEIRDYTYKIVKDARVQQAIGQIYDADRTKRSASYNQKLPQQALSFYQSRSTSSAQPSYSFEVKIYNLDMKEIYQVAQKGYKGEVQLSLGLFLLGQNEPVHLVDFNGKATYGRPATQQQNVEISIQNLFENSWEFFDSWLNSQYLSNRSLTKKVKLQILDPIRPSSKDTVFYDRDRPLTWEDFTDNPDRTSTYNATIYSSMSIQGNASVQNGEIVQTIDIKVYMIPDQSWVKKADDYASNHEQRHFDLTRIAADRMIERLKTVELEPRLFEATLNDIYLDAYREMNRFQEAYDDDTNNGINTTKQAIWNQAISKALDGNMGDLEKMFK
ncbi:hypothetical protein [Algoriphagus sp.]|uniref:hypothetical protein n=1 Tax=Algoriphagus sp. TaxID=1872435 RepID=UPI0032767087